MNTKNTICSCCGKSFVPNRNYNYEHKNNPHWKSFCSKKCLSKERTTTAITTQCAVCGKQIIKAASDVRKSKHNLFFCSSSHNATYWNKHKKTGYRSSKLEKYILSKVQTNYPDIPVLSNDITNINLELDLYFPTLKLAFEFNGIFHYEPIYGTQKLDRIQFNDGQKIIKCHEAGIELCIIDISAQKQFTEKSSQKYLDIVLNIIENVKPRHKNMS
jgi:hypothetical protein